MKAWSLGLHAGFHAAFGCVTLGELLEPLSARFVIFSRELSVLFNSLVVWRMKEYVAHEVFGTCVALIK